MNIYLKSNCLVIDGIEKKIICLNSLETLYQEYTTGHSDYANDKFGYVGLLKDSPDPNYYPFYESDLSFIRQAYDPAYVEFVFPEKGSGPVPNPLWESQSCDTINETIRTNFSEKWYKNSGKSNYIHLIGANKKCNESGPIYDLGISRSYQYINYSYIFTGRIIEFYSTNTINAIADVTVHELAHQFQTTGNGHCTNNAFNPPADGELCVMNNNENLENNIIRFCTEHISTDSNANFDKSIRRQKDDL